MSNNQPLPMKIQQEIEELASSINEIVVKFKELHHPLLESSEKVPKATEQLDKISEQTEAATHQMLDRVEKIVQHVEDSKSSLTEIKRCVTEDRVGEIEGLADALIDKANVTCNDAYTIMDALQFQDITAQQMNHAAALLEDIEAKLQNIMGALKGNQDSQSETDSDKKSRVYDPHADLFEKKTDQSAIDDMFARKT
ncbi:MAG: protein phosphatase CheZ [candidate division Zixibacteria bacterium]|nr:protein phosphatase CheZ [candidate division Zixibacteria bacterium]MDH3939295.1 protein phosphatase CheZ [candidate division Zixibacteria bacterium]MDH4032725.1 protein phosphatase CheZ [candidate division Zixibacteria bacterium]